MKRSLPTRTASLSNVPWLTIVKLAGAAGIGYVVYRLAKGLFPPEPMAIEEVAKEEARKLREQGVQPTYTDVSYSAMADAVEQAAFYIGGTDEDTIFSVMDKMKNDLDIVKLFEAFGSRRMEFSLQSANLGGFLRSELNREEMRKLNAMLAAKGIKTQF